jgi:hypothetical protein
VVNRTRAATDDWAEARCWRVSGAAAAAFLSRIAPHLVLKAEQARLGLRLEELRLSLIPEGKQRARWTDEGLARAAVIKARIHELNRKGPSVDAPSGGFARLVAGVWVTPQADLFSDLGWESYSQAWPTSGMTRSGSVFELRMSAPPTDGSASSSLPTLPTPAAWDGDRGPDYARMNREGSGGDDLVTTMARLLPTPAVNDMGEGKTPEWWDDWTEKMRQTHGNGNGHGKSLAIEAARLLPTPTSQDNAGSRNSTQPRPPDSTANIGDTLTDAVTVLTGVRTRWRSPDGSPSWDESPLFPPTTEDD